MSRSAPSAPRHRAARVMARLEAGVRRATAVALLGALAACGAITPLEPDGDWLYDHIELQSTTAVWEVTVIALEKLDFPIGTGLDPSTLTATSGWRVSLAPFRADGYRQQAVVEYSPGAGGTGWDVRVRVKKQLNMALANPLDLSYAEWEWTDDDTVTAGILLQHIRARLRPVLEVEEPEDDPLEKWRIDPGS